MPENKRAVGSVTSPDAERHHFQTAQVCAPCAPPTASSRRSVSATLMSGDFYS